MSTDKGSSSGGSTSNSSGSKNKTGSVSKGANSVGPMTGDRPAAKDTMPNTPAASISEDSGGGNSIADILNFSGKLPAGTPQSIAESSGGAPVVDLTGGAADNPIATAVTPAASDLVTALTSVVGEAASRPPSISNNFTSLASRAGSKRTLIGGAA